MTAAEIVGSEVSRPAQRISRNVMWNLSGQVAQSLVGVVCIPLLVKVLGLPRVGLLSLIWILVGYFSILDLGLGQALTKTVSEALAARDLGKAARLYHTAARLQAVLGVIGALAMASGATYLVRHVLKVPAELQQEALASVYLCAVAFPLVLLASAATGMLQAAQRFDLIVLIQVPLGIAQFLLPLLCAVWSTNLAVIVAGLLASRVAAMVLLALTVKRVVHLGPAGGTHRKDELTALISFGGAVTISNIVSPMMVFADRFLIGALQTTTAVAYYSVPSDGTLRFLIVPRSIVSALFPVLSATRDPERITELALRSVRYVLLLSGIPILVLFVFARDVMTLWVGAEFASHSTFVLQILLAGIIANSIAQIPFAAIQASGRADITAKIHLCEFPFYVALGYLLIRTWGIEGAAVAWTVRVTADAAILSYLARRLTVVPRSSGSFRPLLHMIASFGLITALGLFGHWALGTNDLQWLLAGAMTLSLAVTGWLFFVTPGERERLQRALSSRLTTKVA